MSYQVIARKWRPNTFEEVTGQEAITQTLRNAIEHERLHHAYLFSGARGVGKTTTARLLAKALNCHKTTKPNPIPCSPNDETACSSCREIAEGRSIDVLEIDAASNTGVDNVREVIINNINISPARDRYKVFIIDEVHMLSTSSFNALLKTLEEPPLNVAFIMATTELHKVPDTILSRCQEFEFRTIAAIKIFERLKLIAEAEKVNITDEALREIARSGEGSMRDAQSNFDQVISFSGEKIEIIDVTNALGLASSEMLTRIIQAISDKNPKEVLNVVEDLIRRGHDLRNFCRDLLSFLRDLLVAKVADDAESLLESSILSAEDLNKYATNFTEADLIRFFNSLSDTETQLRVATQPRYILEIGLVKLIEMRRVAPLENILERLVKLESAFSGAKLPIENIPQKTEKPIVLSDFSPPTEKKTSIIDFPLEEVPFPTGNAIKSNFSEVSEIAQTIEIEQEPIIEQPAIVEEEIPKPIIKSSISAEFLDSVAMKLPTISSEDLEHIDDNWLDSAYEDRLLREGDNLLVIGTIKAIITNLLGSNSLINGAAQTVSQTSNGSSATAAVSARTSTVPIFIPSYELEDPNSEIVELSENPTEEELLHYAENHPIVIRALKIFRGKIVKVSRES
jgi:DNA polymerase III subunit gamma/tau